MIVTLGVALVQAFVAIVLSVKRHRLARRKVASLVSAWVKHEYRTSPRGDYYQRAPAKTVTSGDRPAGAAKQRQQGNRIVASAHVHERAEPELVVATRGRSVVAATAFGADRPHDLAHPRRAQTASADVVPVHELPHRPLLAS